MKNDSEVMLSNLPNFWRIGKGYIDGRFKKVHSVARRALDSMLNPAGQLANSSMRSPQQARSMAQDIVKLYVTLLSEFFALSDKSVQSPSSTGPPPPPFLPQGGCTLTVSYYLLRILNELNECVNDVAGVELGVDANTTMKSLLESARWRFEDALAAAWCKGS